MANSLRLITFDVTETLLKFRTPVAVKYAEYAEKFGIHTDSKAILKNFKNEWKNMSEQHPNFGRDTGLGWRKWWSQIVVNAFSSEVPYVEKALLTELADNLIEEYATSSCWVLADGATDLLRLLKEKGMLLGVISNNDERLEKVLESLSINSYFDVVASSYRIGVMKPDRKIFDVVLKEVSDSLLPENCLHIGNSVKFDYMGARNAGWQAFYFGAISTPILTEVNPSHAFQSFLELQNYFQQRL